MEGFTWKLNFGSSVTVIEGGVATSKKVCEMLITESQKQLLDTISDIEIDECGNKIYIINRQRFKLSLNIRVKDI